MNECLNCGHIYKSSRYASRSYKVNSCSKCTRRFPDNIFEELMQDIIADLRDIDRK